MDGSRPAGYICLRRTIFRESYSRHALYILLVTFICYALLHASRKPISVVKGVLHTGPVVTSKRHNAGWVPFGIFQSMGWPAVVCLMGNWWGKKRRGLIMGLWNANTSVGNILGSLIAGYYADRNWGHAFAVPGVVLIMAGLLVMFTIIERPEEARLRPNRLSKSPLGSLQEIGPMRSASEPCLFKPTHSDQDYALPESMTTKQAITFWDALFVPNVAAYSVLLFFAKLVSYTFLYWLPNYLAIVEPNQLSAERAAQLSVLFDLGGIVGGVVAGLVSDSKEEDSDSDTIWRRAVTCSVMLALAAPLLLLYLLLASATGLFSLVILFFCGMIVNGPYALITTAVAADLGTQRSLQGRARALATIAAIIDGTGSFGAALGPFLTGLLVPYGWSAVFTMLITSDLFALAVSIWIACRSQRRDVVYSLLNPATPRRTPYPA